jgi:hypothetical protein
MTSFGRRFLGIAVAGLVALVGGCSECDEGDRACDGDGVRVCNTDGDGPFRGRWQHFSCGVTCVDLGGPTCTASREPVPECMNGRRNTCYEGVPTICRGGYPLPQIPCEAGTQCVAPGPDVVAFCAAAPEPIAECSGAGTQPICFDGRPARCRSGYPMFEGAACNAPTRCAVSATCGAICVVGDPDPRCAQGSFCDRNDVVTCQCEFVASRHTCSTSKGCREAAGETACTESQEPDPRCGDPTQRWSAFCDGDVATNCWYGFIETTSECQPSRCSVVTAAQRAGCSLPSSTPQQVPNG